MKKKLVIVSSFVVMLALLCACQPNNGVLPPPPVVNETPDGTPVSPSNSDDFNAIFSYGASGTYYLATNMENLTAQLDVKAKDGGLLRLDGNGKTISRNVGTTGNKGDKAIVQILNNNGTIAVRNINISGISTNDINKWNDGEFGIKVYNSKNVSLSDLSVTNANAGILIGSDSNATLLGTIDVSGNKYGGINVDDSTLTIAYDAEIICNDNTVPAIWKDSAADGTVNYEPGTLVEYTISGSSIDGKNGQVWYLTPEQDADFNWEAAAGLQGAPTTDAN